MVAGKLKAYKIKLTPVAEGTYRKFAESAAGPIQRGELGHAAVKRMRLIDECLDMLIPHAPFSTDRALVGALSNIFRVKKGRIRICYIASSAKFEITILYISETLRKEGDRSDPYAIFGSMVTSGKFDEFFAALGVKTPKSSAGHIAFSPMDYSTTPLAMGCEFVFLWFA